MFMFTRHVYLSNWVIYSTLLTFILSALQVNKANSQMISTKSERASMDDALFNLDEVFPRSYDNLEPPSE